MGLATHRIILQGRKYVQIERCYMARGLAFWTCPESIGASFFHAKCATYPPKSKETHTNYHRKCNGGASPSGTWVPVGLGRTNSRTAKAAWSLHHLYLQFLLSCREDLDRRILWFSVGFYYAPT